MENKLLLKELHLKLNEIKNQNDGIITISNKSIIVCREYLLKLYESVEKSPFKNEEEEIYFFKNEIVFPLSMLVYFGKTRIFEIEFPKVDVVQQKKYIKKKIRRVNKFYAYNSDFIQYIDDKRKYLDRTYFTRVNINYLNFSNTKLCYRSPKTSTSHDFLLAEYRGLELYLNHLKQKLTGVKCQNYSLSESGMNWTGSKTDLTELIYALHSSKVINNGVIDISEIASSMEMQFNIDLGDFYRTFISIRSRINQRTKFIETLKDSVTNLMEELDR